MGDKNTVQLFSRLFNNFYFRYMSQIVYEVFIERYFCGFKNKFVDFLDSDKIFFLHSVIDYRL